MCVCTRQALVSTSRRLLQPLGMAKTHISKSGGSLGGPSPLDREGKEVPDEDAMPGLSPDAPPRTFIDSLQLSDRDIEDLAKGNFLYLKRRRSGGSSGNVYDMQVVAHSAINPANYCTLSRAGITHFTGKDSEFSSLEQWEREYRLFGQMNRIPFFSKYRIWKSFVVWKKNVRRRRCADASKSLLSGLFMLNPVLRVSLLRLRRLCVAFAECKLFECDPKKTYDLEEFCALQVCMRVRGVCVVCFTCVVCECVLCVFFSVLRQPPAAFVCERVCAVDRR